MNHFRTILSFVGLLMLTACAKFPIEDLQGYWKPIYASGYQEDAVYIITFDGPVDELGQVQFVRASKSDPGIKEEGAMVIPSIRFFHENGEDVFSYFWVNGSDVMRLLHYYIKKGKIYFERPVSGITNDNTSQAHYDKGTPIQFLGDDQVKMGDVTYQKVVVCQY